MTGIPFPALDPVAIHFGPFGLRWYSLAYLAGIVLSWFLTKRMVRRYPSPVSDEMIDDSFFWMTVGMILGGRLGYVFFYNFGYYWEHPWQIFALWRGGMSFHGGLLGVIAAMFFYTRSVRVGFFDLSDLIACVTPIGLFFGRLANFVNAELYGRVTAVPWGVVFPHAVLCPATPASFTKAVLKAFYFLFCFIRCGRGAYGCGFVRGLCQGCFWSGMPRRAACWKTSANPTRKSDFCSRG